MMRWVKKKKINNQSTTSTAKITVIQRVSVNREREASKSC